MTAFKIFDSNKPPLKTCYVINLIIHFKWNVHFVKPTQWVSKNKPIPSRTCSKIILGVLLSHYQDAYITWPPHLLWWLQVKFFWGYGSSQVEVSPKPPSLMEAWWRKESLCHSSAYPNTTWEAQVSPPSHALDDTGRRMLLCLEMLS